MVIILYNLYKVFFIFILNQKSLLVILITTIQAGLLTPLTFARHRLSPLAAFTSGAYFLHNGRR